MPEEPGKTEEQKPVEAGPAAPKSSNTGLFLVGGVLLVIAAVSFKDGFVSPPEGWERWKIVFNQVVTVVGGIGGLAAIIYALLQPRTSPPPDDKDNEKPVSGS